MLSVGDVLAVSSLVLVVLTTVLTFGTTRRELAICRKDRIELRRNLQVVVSALLSTLPLEQRVGLLQNLDEWVRPREDE